MTLECWIDVRMSLEWWNDMGMSSEDWNFWWRWFWSSLTLGHPCHFDSLWNDHFVILWSFQYWMTSEWSRWCWNDHFSSWDDGWMTWMGVKWGNVWSKSNALDILLYHSVLIPTTFHHLPLIQCFKWVLNYFQSFII